MGHERSAAGGRLRVPRLRRLLRGGPGRPVDDRDEWLGATVVERRIVEQALPYTMTSRPRLLALIDAARYLTQRSIEGAFVECGVWRGGSMLALILALQELAAPPRDLFLYDTFEGMPAPSEVDRSPATGSVRDSWERSRDPEGRAWPDLFGSEVFDEESVRETLLSTGYPADRLHVVRGPVEETVPARAPDEIALLRLDTDWYESTRHELKQLYPRLAPGGVLIVDDYGHWEGARTAVDEYFAREAPQILLSRIDYTGRIGVKR